MDFYPQIQKGGGGSSNFYRWIFIRSVKSAYAGLPDTADATNTTTTMSNTHTAPGLLFNMGSNTVNNDNELKMSPIRSPFDSL